MYTSSTRSANRCSADCTCSSYPSAAGACAITNNRLTDGCRVSAIGVAENGIALHAGDTSGRTIEQFAGHRRGDEHNRRAWTQVVTEAEGELQGARRVRDDQV